MYLLSLIHIFVASLEGEAVGEAVAAGEGDGLVVVPFPPQPVRANAARAAHNMIFIDFIIHFPFFLDYMTII